MSGRIIRGYWSCKYCRTADIDGLVDVCPNCGKQKSSDVKYYMKQGIAEEVTDTELQKAKIKKEECDGIQFLIKGIYTYNGMLYVHTQTKNSSNVPFLIPLSLSQNAKSRRNSSVISVKK